MLLNLRAQFQRCAVRAATQHGTATQEPFRQFRRSYIYGGVQPKTGPPKRHGAPFIRWIIPEVGSELPTLNAKPRERKGRRGYDLNHLREVENRVPISIEKRAPPGVAKPMQIEASIATKDLMAVVDKNMLFSQVFNIKIEGRDEPIKAICATYDDDQNAGNPMNVLFTYFEPGKRYKIQVPCFLENFDDCFALKKGAVLQKMDDFIPVYWKGDEHIPKAIVIDLEKAKPPTTFKLQWDSIPEGMTQRKPDHLYTLATMKGSRKYYRLGDEEEDE